MTKEGTVSLKMYRSHVKPTWCPGCGDYGVLTALQRAALELNIKPSNMVVVSGIGCSSQLPHFMSTYGFHSIHGRALPVAMGIRLANPELTVVITGGDGDGYGIGAGHFVHACRRNIDMTYIVMDNSIYGLTTGQASPTTLSGSVTKSTPKGYELHESPLNPLAVALASGATFVARGFSGDSKHLASLVVEGIKHRGFAVIDVFSPCVTFQKQATYDFYREHVFYLDKEGHDPENFIAAMEQATRSDKLGIGIFYRKEKPIYEDYEPALKKGPLPYHELGLKNDDPLLKQFY